MRDRISEEFLLSPVPSLFMYPIHTHFISFERVDTSHSTFLPLAFQSPNLLGTLSRPFVLNRGLILPSRSQFTFKLGDAVGYSSYQTLTLMSSKRTNTNDKHILSSRLYLIVFLGYL